jgi:hypothetical protein
MNLNEIRGVLDKQLQKSNTEAYGVELPFSEAAEMSEAEWVNLCVKMFRYSEEELVEVAKRARLKAFLARKVVTPNYEEFAFARDHVLAISHAWE